MVIVKGTVDMGGVHFMLNVEKTNNCLWLITDIKKLNIETYF